jgi:hypothetical protein
MPDEADGRASPGAPVASRRATLSASDLREQLQSQIAEFDPPQRDLAGAIRWLHERTRLPLLVRWDALRAAGVRADVPIALTARDLPAWQLIQWVLDDAAGSVAPLGYYTSDDGTIVISTVADCWRRTTFERAYDVHDLLPAGKEQTAAGSALVDWIQTALDDGGGWDGPATSIQFRDGVLQVIQAAENHRRLGNFLGALRSSKAAQTDLRLRYFVVRAAGLQGPIEDVIDRLHAATGSTITPLWDVIAPSIHRSTFMRLQLDRVPLYIAIDELADNLESRSTGPMAWFTGPKGAIILTSGPDAFAAAGVERNYDIDDLLADMPAGSVFETRMELEVMDWLRRQVDPPSWRGEKETAGWLRIRNRQLTVFQLPENHQRVTRALRTFRTVRGRYDRYPVPQETHEN